MKKIKNLLMVILGNKFFSVLIENYISTRIRVNLKNISKFKSIDVYFICDDFSLFKYDNLYNRMIASDRYNPTILITKEKSFIYDNKSIRKKMNETKELFISRGYNVTKMNFLG